MLEYYLDPVLTVVYNIVKVLGYIYAADSEHFVSVLADFLVVVIVTHVQEINKKCAWSVEHQHCVAVFETSARRE